MSMLTFSIGAVAITMLVIGVFFAIEWVFGLITGPGQDGE